LHAPSRKLKPQFYPFVKRSNRDQATDSELLVVSAPDKVVSDRHVMTSTGQVQRRRPSQIAVAAKYKDSHYLSWSQVGRELWGLPTPIYLYGTLRQEIESHEPLSKLLKISDGIHRNFLISDDLSGI